MKTKIILLTLVLLCGCSRSGIPASDAKNHIGEHATVYGIGAAIWPDRLRIHRDCFADAKTSF